MSQVYYPKSTSKIGIFLATTFGIACSKIIVLSIGIGLATGLTTVPAWSAAFKESNGALVVAGLAPLGTFGKFCGVILALGLVANQVPGKTCVPVRALQRCEKAKMSFRCVLLLV
jgi:purine-cytosine permease-like protein